MNAIPRNPPSLPDLILKDGDGEFTARFERVAGTWMGHIYSGDRFTEQSIPMARDLDTQSAQERGQSLEQCRRAFMKLREAHRI